MIAPLRVLLLIGGALLAAVLVSWALLTPPALEQEVSSPDSAGPREGPVLKARNGRLKNGGRSVAPVASSVPDPVIQIQRVRELGSEDPGLRSAVAAELRQAPKAALRAILDLLKGTSEDRRLAFEAWEHVSPEGVEHLGILRVALRDDQLRDLSLRVLKPMGPHAAPVLEELVSLVGTDQGRSSTSLQLALIAIGEPAIPPLVQRTRSSDERVRRDALTILWMSITAGTPVPSAPLIDALASSDVVARKLAVQALRDSRPRTSEIERALQSAAQDDDEFVRSVARDALEAAPK